MGSENFSFDVEVAVSVSVQPAGPVPAFSCPVNPGPEALLRVLDSPERFVHVLTALMPLVVTTAESPQSP